MTITFYSGHYLKQWPNWTGVVPQIGDKVLLHFGDNNEEERAYRVVDRYISGTEPDEVIIHLEWKDRKKYYEDSKDRMG